jgi:hypothetical protein
MAPDTRASPIRKMQTTPRLEGERTLNKVDTPPMNKETLLIVPKTHLQHTWKKKPHILIYIESPTVSSVAQIYQTQS